MTGSLQFMVAAADQDEACAGVDEGLRNAEADAFAAAGDDGMFPFQEAWRGVAWMDDGVSAFCMNGSPRESFRGMGRKGIPA